MFMEIRLDYATINFDSGCADLDQISKTLCGDFDLSWVKCGKTETALERSPFGLSYLHNSGWAPRPHRLQVSGVGCTKFEYTLPQLVVMCNKNGGECSFSRLDFAFDVLIKKDDWKKFIVHAFESSLSSDRERKVYRLAGSGEAMTVYIGSRKQAKFFRIYNKTLEDNAYDYFGDGTHIPDDCYVIRYEVELKRTVYNRGGNKVVYDPSQYFYDYYNCDQSLCDVIRDLWISFGDEVLLPDGFEGEEITLRSKNKNFASISVSTAVEYTEKKISDYPQSFDRTLMYVIEKFGKYIPWLLVRKDTILQFEHLCRNYCGFLPEYDLEALTHSGCMDDIDDCEDLPIEWTQSEINLDEGRLIAGDFEN